jgi:hypothetical protein
MFLEGTVDVTPTPEHAASKAAESAAAARNRAYKKQHLIRKEGKMLPTPRDIAGRRSRRPRVLLDLPTFLTFEKSRASEKNRKSVTDHTACCCRAHACSKKKEPA